MSAGISKIVAEVILVVLGVALAIVILTPAGSYIFNTLGMAPPMSDYKFKVINVKPWDDSYLGYSSYGPALVVYVQNEGDKPIPRTTIKGDNPGTCWYTGGPQVRWPVMIRNETGLYGNRDLWTTCAASVGGQDVSLDLDPGEIWAIYYPGMAQDPNQMFTVMVVGPGAVKGIYVYVPP